MDDDIKDNGASGEDVRQDEPSPGEAPPESGVPKETPVAPPEPPVISEEEKKKIIEEERLRVEKEEKMKAEAVAAYKKEHKKPFGFVKILLVFIVIIGVVIAAGYLTFEVIGNQNAWGDSYPYVATYDVLLPDSSEVFFGNVAVLAVSSGNDVTLKIGNERQILSIGTPVDYAPGHMTVKMYGTPIRESDYRMTITYRGLVENRLDFLITVRTSEPPMATWMRDLFVPSQATVRPV